MCAINGIFAYHYAANPIDRVELARTCDYMAARGPDGRGEWVADDERVALAHRRLSIIDLSEAGAQPMASADGNLVVTFNGEIYNYRELRCKLEARGYIFKSKSDTEVLLHLYADKGEKMVRELHGMFAFAIWERGRRTLFLARDPYGIKPLYYADDGWTLRFASQVKALLAGKVISREPEPAGQVGFYLWGSIPEPFTTYLAIRAVPAGATISINQLGAQTAQYHSIAQVYRGAENNALHRLIRNQEEAREMIRQALLDSTRRHLVADVPVGAFLSAGIDSSVLVGLMRDAGQQDIQTVTLAFEEFRGQPMDEAPLAESVARLYGTRHATRVVTEAEFRADLPRIFEAMDQPTIDGINSWFVSKAARELGLKVAISGVGGDELFRGYPSFQDIPRWVRLLTIPSRVPGLGRTARVVGQDIGRMLGLNPKIAGMLELGGGYPGAYLLRRGLFMPWELRQVLDQRAIERGLRRLAPLHHIATELGAGLRSPLAKVAVLESAFYLRNQLLRDTDWASMAHSLEVRTPLVDSVLLSEVADIYARVGAPSRSLAPKADLAQSPSIPLPSGITRRKKTGFTTPVERWMSCAIQDTESPGAWRRKPGRNATPWARDWSQKVAETILPGPNECRVVP
jgi:asparagine synthase (glutamine-hydrolysing)